MTDYPLFVPPSPVASKPRRNWTSEDAEFYFKWLMGNLPRRTNQVMQWFGEEDQVNRAAVLTKIGEKFSAALPTPQFSKAVENSSKLTNQGYAIAADLGLLVARFLCEECGPSARWEILRKPKNDMSYNLPVLMGFHIYFEPVGGVIAESKGMLRGVRSGDVLAETFLFWKNKSTQNK